MERDPLQAMRKSLWMAFLAFWRCLEGLRTPSAPG
jgi:hypothetical protein